MATMKVPRFPIQALRSSFSVRARTFTTAYPGTPASSPPRHFLSIKDLSAQEFKILVDNATKHKKALQALTPQQHGSYPLSTALSGRTIPMVFSKRSTRTRISTEGAVVALGGHPMFLGRDDIQLGVNESTYDTSVVISSMTSGIVARVNKHSDIAELAKDSSVPVINALCDHFHPMQIVADFACLSQALNTDAYGLRGMKIAWVGDANNVLFDMLFGARRLGIEMSVATPKGYEIPETIKEMLDNDSELGKASAPAKIFQTNEPEEAVKGADVIVTDTWVSMGQEAEAQKKLKDFAGFQVTRDLIERAGASKDWKFMHCLPRHKEEVDDEVFHSDRSLVFPEAQNRLWSAIAVLEAFVVNKGEIRKTDAWDRVDKSMRDRAAHQESKKKS